MEIFKLFGSVFVKTDEAEKSIAKVDKQGGEFAKTIEDMTGKANKFALGLGVAITGAVGSMFALTVKTAETADEIDKMSERTGIGRERLQELKYAAGQCGVEFGAIENGVKTLTKNMGKADDESKRMVDAFKEMDISINDTNGKLKASPDLFEEVIHGLADMEDVTKRNILGTKVFGGSWNEMVPLINQGSDGIEQLALRARDLGIVMDEETIKANVVFGDTMDDVKQSAGAVGVAIANKVLPYFQKFLDWVLENMPTIQEKANNIFEKLGKIVTWVGDNMNWLVPIIGGLVAALVTLNIINTVNKLMALWQASTFAQTLAQEGLNAALAANPIGLVILAIGLLVAGILYLWNNCEWFREGITNMFNGLKEFFENTVMPIWEKLKNVIVENFGFVWDSIQSIWGNIKGYFQGIIDFVVGVFTGDWSRAWEGVKAIFINLWEGLTTYMKLPLNFMIKGLNIFIKGLSKIKIPDWVPGIGGKGINIPEIPMLAKGTDYFKGGYAIVGEQGPELVQMPRGSKVTPNGETESLLNREITIVNNTYLDGKLIATETKKAIGREQNQYNVGRGRLGFA